MRVLLTFYQNFNLISITVTVITCVLILLSGSPYYIVMAFWIKVISNAGLLGHIHFFRPHQFDFFLNLGYSQKQLYLRSLAIDFGIWFILAYTTLKMR